MLPFSAGVIERLPGLKLIAVSRGGPVNIDMAAARERKIRVVNTPGRNASAVAEFAIGAILAETRMITKGNESLRRGEWRGDLYRADIAGEELSEMTVGVIGYGHVGAKVVRLLKAFGCRILVCDPYVQLSVDDLRDGVVQVALDRILRESDVVTLHARVTEETRGFIAREQFEEMKRGAYFVNTARGPMVDYDALTQALKTGHLRGAALDTFAVEPVRPDLELLGVRQCDVVAAYRGRVGQDGEDRRCGGGRGGPPLPCRRGPAESLLSHACLVEPRHEPRAPRSSSRRE